jgi:hypothetical protein
MLIERLKWGKSCWAGRTPFRSIVSAATRERVTGGYPMQFDLQCFGNVGCDDVVLEDGRRRVNSSSRIHQAEWKRLLYACLNWLLYSMSPHPSLSPPFSFQ